MFVLLLEDMQSVNALVEMHALYWSLKYRSITSDSTVYNNNYVKHRYW